MAAARAAMAMAGAMAWLNREDDGAGGSGGGGDSVAVEAKAMATVVATIVATLVAMVVARVVARTTTRAAAAMARQKAATRVKASRRQKPALQRLASLSESSNEMDGMISVFRLWLRNLLFFTLMLSLRRRFLQFNKKSRDVPSVTERLRSVAHMYTTTMRTW